MRTKLGLGTVQLGTSYGNKSHLQVMSEANAHKILEAAHYSGISYFDTAASYGESEERLGKFLAIKSCEKIRVATKIPPTSKDIWSNQNKFRKFVFDSIRMSKNRLKTNLLDSVLFHQCDIEFLEHPVVKNTIREALNENACSKIGVSVYEPIQAQAALEIDEITCLQIPLNILDLRFADPTLTKLYKSKNIEVIARSIFLQGLLVESATLPQVKRKSELVYLKGLCIDAARQESKQTLEEISINYVADHFHDFLGVAIVGVQSVEELNRNLDMIRRDGKTNSSCTLKALKRAQEYAAETKLTNPAFWNN